MARTTDSVNQYRYPYYSGGFLKRRFMIMGNGDLGVTIAARLSMLGMVPEFVGRRIHASDRSRFEGFGGDVSLSIHPLNRAQLRNIGGVFVAVRAYDLVGAIERYMPYIPKKIPIICVSPGAIEDTVRGFSKKYPHHFWRIGLCRFTTNHISEGIYRLKHRGSVVWGPLEQKVQNPARNMMPIEQELLNADGGHFFKWRQAILADVHKKWLFDTVVNSLCAAHELPTVGLLLNDLKMLKLVLVEGYRLGQELYGPWEFTCEKFFEDLVCYISTVNHHEAVMVRHLRLQQKIENKFFAGQASGRHAYPLLENLSKLIRQKSHKKNRR